jgi:hypothetical protein
MVTSYTVFFKTQGKSERIIIEANDHYIDGDLLKLRNSGSTVAVFSFQDIYGFVVGGKYSIPQT